MVRKMIFVLIFLLSFVSSSGIWAEEKIGECLGCHQKETRGIFQAWVNSKHAKVGVDCITCHTNHEKAKAKKSVVEPEACAKCHKERLDQFREGRHAISWNGIKDHPQYQALSDPLKKAFCERCHNIQYKCNSCHTPLPSTRKKQENQKPARNVMQGWRVPMMRCTPPPSMERFILRART